MSHNKLSSVLVDLPGRCGFLTGVSYAAMPTIRDVTAAKSMGR